MKLLVLVLPVEVTYQTVALVYLQDAAFLTAKFCRTNCTI